MLFSGVMTAIVTPFRDGKVDEEAFRRLIDWQIEEGVNGLVPVGTTGESATLSHEEHRQVIEICVDQVKGRVKVLAGAGSNNTIEAIQLTEFAKKAGADGALLITPYYNKPTQEGLYQHYAAVAKAVDLPIVPYNVPGRTGLDIAPETIDRLAESGRFVALKESSYDLPRVMEKISAMRGRLTLYSGNDDMIYPLLALGAEGVISVLANVAPAYVSGMTGAYFSGKTEKALTMQTECLPLVRALFSEVSPIPCKYAMELLGLCGGELRLPLIGAGENTRRKLREALVQMGILIA